jgi:8-oxo-dGTP diphosphatase
MLVREFSGSMRGEYILRRVDVASALIFDETLENVLMVRNKRGDSSDWSLPGGAVEPGETLEQAVIRETKEEAGVDIEIEGLHSVREVFFTEVRHHALIFAFKSKIIKGELESFDPDNEILEVKWVDVSTANEILAELPVPLIIKPENKHMARYSFHGNV